MSASARIAVPAALAASYRRNGGEAEREWIDALPGLVDRFLDEWTLEPDGQPRSGEAALVLPVRRTGGGRAALRLQMPKTETRAALIGLRVWDGAGVVRLLDSDPETCAMLLERLDDTRTLADVEDDDEAMTVLAGLLRKLTPVTAPGGVPRLGDIAAEMLAQTPAAMAALTDPADRELLGSCAAAVRELAGEPGDRLLHWDLHHGNVLAADREPWLAIDPEPLAGDPGFDLWPALDGGWDAVVATGEPVRVVRRRFDLLTAELGLDRDRAAGWTLGRVLQNCLWDVEDGATALDRRQVTMAAAMRSAAAATSGATRVPSAG
ncbi:aminoglycoside phosphotransferase family protein [Lentzea sp. NBRC 102530]|uniref:aminoglycoside phosphotransferase family protein n=1 Tax=Lentzea sp. NBRC 102530 TaxID=3032201 RepID=UPI0024A23367|nr:aminoglycoside phosphotransferase family protein [Lentzea sp. NBRC 102530]GLY50805.1 hydroxyurea phosphotransferase [Lentzea sp. NBRC 102530]